MKPTILKAWPEMEEFTPLLTSPSKASKPTPFFNIDFTECVSFDSCGLASFLLKIIQYTKRFKESTSWIATIGLDNDSILRKDNIVNLGFFIPIINSLHDPILRAEYISSNENPINLEVFGAIKLSFPLVYINFTDGIDRRETGIKLLKQIFYKTFQEYSQIYKINTMQILVILIELVKNTADHTKSDAIIGFDMFKTNNSIKINFLYGDFGIGIMRHVRKYLKQVDDQRWKNISFADAYYIACNKGWTSKPNSGKNLGMGMSTVIEFAKTMNMRLSVFDASSRCLLSDFDVINTPDAGFQIDSPTHTRIRRKFFNYSLKNPFCYFGTVEAEKK
jgi:hypothetical protein